MISSEGYYGSSEVCPNVSGSSDTSCPLHVDCQPSISVHSSPKTRFGQKLNFILLTLNNQGFSSTNKQCKRAPGVFTVSWVLPAKHTTPGYKTAANKVFGRNEIEHFPPSERGHLICPEGKSMIFLR